jgi:hypothetical protein
MRSKDPVSRLWHIATPCAVCVALLGLSGWSALAAETRLPNHVPDAVSRLQPIGRLDPGTNLSLAIGLPWRNQGALTNLLRELYDSAGTNYHHWLTAEQFAQKFGPTEEDYQKVLQFAAARGLKVTGRAANRMLVDVQAPAATIENALQLTLRLYSHPTENRTFYAPDAEPSIDADLPILHISGLDNFVLPHPLTALKPRPLAASNGVTPFYTGSAPGGYFMGNDFRAAYVPGVTNTGVGQYVAIVDVGGPYYPNDIYIYQTNAGLSTNIALTNIFATLDSYWTNALTGSNTDDGEEALDICMAMSMAPGATILNYEGGADDVFNRIASDNKAKQMTLSYGFGIDVLTVQSFQEFLAQGQAMSQASGDGDADLNGGTGLTGNPYATIVGGTTLTTSGAGGPWSSETAWNWDEGGGSGGGISGYGIPTWQQGVANSANQGSAVYRNYPDVAMPADGVFLVSKNGSSVGWVGGTSCASPLWAGFMALVNQQAVALGHSAIGFPNPAIYALGKGSYSAYTNAFHDIVTGSNTNSQNPTRFFAETGYDLCTGWGTPRGSNTITALVGVGTNDFALFPSIGALNLVPGGNATVTMTVAPMNRFSGAVSLALSGLPASVTASFSPVSTTNSSLLTLSVGTQAVPSNYSLTITGTSGTLAHSLPLSLAIVAPVPGVQQVSLSSAYNRSGIWSDGRSFSGGLDGDGYAYSANLLDTTPSWNGIAFNLGPANAADAVSCAGQTISLPAGSFTSLQVLGTGANGSQSAQTFTVTNTDNSSLVITQSFSDWASPQYYAGESVAAGMAYRNNGGGSKDLYTAVNLYNYTLTINQTKTAKSLTLPNNANVVVLALALANEPAPVTLASYYNRAGIYSDDETFTNPATGGIDGIGDAYSATLLTGSQIWTNTLFTFGPANATNVISAANQVVSLPAGYYNALRMLATGVEGDQTAQSFTVKYTDGTTSAFSQSLSDWYTPQNYAGETKAILMGHRNLSNGTEDGRTFYLYGYAFKLNSSKVVQSLTLPNNANVIVTAISLVPNWPPTFKLNPFSEPAVTAGQNYAASVATNATDLNGDSLTFAKVSGSSWLTVAGNGSLSGTPLSANVGANAFLVSVSDPGGLSNTATLNINVQAAPPIVSSLANTTNTLLLTWSGGIAPFQVQSSTNLAGSNWINTGSPISSNTLAVLPTNPAAFYRIMGH